MVLSSSLIPWELQLGRCWLLDLGRERKEIELEWNCNSIEHAWEVLIGLAPGSVHHQCISALDLVDQASIIGGTIDSVKELQHDSLSLMAQKSRNQCDEEGCQSPSRSYAIPNGFFSSYSPLDRNAKFFEQSASSKITAQSQSIVVDVEVTMTEAKATMKVLSQKRLRQLQLLHAISALYNLAISILY
ncbi:hypothetical protein SUGI_1091810 [Cryptomeria japonica]|uniref:transcription factor bHLH71-like n=1 Tax=Cryptomeria japonica TaxID=3369 RepID=UPI002414C93D|nr:transcription factor bHLH71-like [Cryptomeria japonica]GLJ51349.1 hypothetical protein SUGI_1091810 [Cryptomeria japonica]